MSTIQLISPRLLLTITTLLLIATSQSEAQLLEWSRQLGTTMEDESFGISADSLGNVYLTGETFGNLGGPIDGKVDAFVSKYDATGVLQWSRQLGTSANESGVAVSADGLGGVYISGRTGGNLGGPQAGSDDAFISKYDAAGILQWTRQLGTDGRDESLAVSADGLGNVYISGDTQGSLGGPFAGDIDAFVSKYDASGAHLWTRQLGTSGFDRGFGVSADGLGNVYLAGWTNGSLGGPHAGDQDAFVSKYDTAGILQWTRQLGTGALDSFSGVSADGLGNVYLSGTTEGDLNEPNTGGEGDALIAKYDAAGNLLWTRLLGSEGREFGLGISSDGIGNAYLSGTTLGAFYEPKPGFYDAFVGKYDSNGNLEWTQQIGTSARDVNSGVAADGLGNVYLTGSTEGNLVGINIGREDAFLLKFSDVPEPASLVLLLVSSASLAAFRRHLPC